MSVTIITGASRGIGAATARRLATTPPGGPSTTLVIGYTSNEVAAHNVVDELEQRGTKAVAVQADIALEADVERLFAQADELGPLTALVNNAGIVAPIAPFETYSAERIQRLMAVNVTGAFLCAREAVRRLSTELGGPGGAIVNVSSRASTMGSPNEFIDYAATKGAVDAMTIGLAAELGTRGVRVNAVRPGLIETELHADTGHPDRVEQLVANVPMRRAGSAEEVANLIVWLLSSEASYVTGALIDVGGGR